MHAMGMLEGIRIIDFSRLLPGPLATKLLQQQGAEVIKIENGEGGDWLKYTEPCVNGTSVYYQALNNGKNVRVSDFNDEHSKLEIETLISTCDIVVEQFRPGVMDAWGFGYEKCKSIKHDVVYVSLTGYGQNSINRNRAGHDINYLAESGVLSLLRDSNGKPILPGIQLADIAAGSFMLMNACLTGLYQRDRKKSSVYIDVSIVEGLKPFMVFAEALQFANGDPSSPGFLNGGLVNYNLYKTSDNKWVALGALELKFWNKFCELIGKEEWKRMQLTELSCDTFNLKLLEDVFRASPIEYWEALGRNHDVCLSPVVEYDL